MVNVLKLSAALLSVSAYAWFDVFYDNDYPFSPPHLYNISAARRHPNATRSVPVTIGEIEKWNFTVSLAEVPAQGENATGVNDPRVLLTLYDVQPPEKWTGNQDPGLSTPVHYPEGTFYEFFWTVSYWPFSVSATNAYETDDSSPGDCTGVVDTGCLRRLRTMNGTAAELPDSTACENVTTRWGGLGATFLVQRSSLDDPWLWQLGGYISDVYPATNRTLYERERQRVHLATLSGNDTHVVCARVKTDQVSAGNPGTGTMSNGGADLVRAVFWNVIGLVVLSVLL